MPKLGWTPEKSVSRFQLYNEDCREVAARLEPNSIDSIVTDPPYGLKFMGKDWDYGIPGEEFWRLFLQIAKPSSYLLAFGGTRTYHRLTCAIEDAGWEIRDCLSWLYGTGFPKGKACLKPAWEPIILARKPGKGVQEFNIDSCRILCEKIVTVQGQSAKQQNGEMYSGKDNRNKSVFESHPLGRWPANVVHDGSEEVLNPLPVNTDGFSKNSNRNGHSGNKIYGERNADTKDVGYGGGGSVARFFYCAKSSNKDRDEGLEGIPKQRTGGMQATADGSMLTGSGNPRITSRANTHPTVKPTELMRWLIRLITPFNGVVFDPFMGSGSTGKASGLENRQFIGCENDIEHGYFQIAEVRIKGAYSK